MVRFKHRYLLVHLVFPEQLPADAASTSTSTSTLPSSASPPPVVTESRLISLLRDSLSVNFGDVGAGEVGGTFSGPFLIFSDVNPPSPVTHPLFSPLDARPRTPSAVKYLSPTTSTVILRVAREHYRTLWAALTLLRKVDNHECIARVLHVSGPSPRPIAAFSLSSVQGAKTDWIAWPRSDLFPHPHPRPPVRPLRHPHRPAKQARSARRSTRRSHTTAPRSSSAPRPPGSSAGCTGAGERTRSWRQGPAAGRDEPECSRGLRRRRRTTTEERRRRRRR